jgi:pyrroline-5-carboxylate reductase
MENLLGSDKRIVRVMPNTPCKIGAGASGFSLGNSATEDDAKTVDLLLNSVGVACQVTENQLDAVTGVSGCGPAYIYLLIEAMADGGVKMGLSREIALKLAT